MSNRTIHWVRLGFPHLFEPRAIVQNGVQTGEPRFGANLHLPEGFDVLSLQQEIAAVWAAKWPDPTRRPPMAGAPGGDPNAWTNTLPGYLRQPLVWGPKDYPEDPNAKGWVLLTSAKADSPPVVVKMVGGQPVQVTDRGEVYPGCECHAGVSFFAYDKGAQSKGLSCGLNGVQLTGRDLGRFDQKPSLAQMFGTSAAAPPPPPPLPVGAIPAAPAAPPAFGAPQPQYGAPQPQYGAPTPPAHNPFG